MLNRYVWTSIHIIEIDGLRFLLIALSNCDEKFMYAGSIYPCCAHEFKTHTHTHTHSAFLSLSLSHTTRSSSQEREREGDLAQQPPESGLGLLYRPQQWWHWVVNGGEKTRLGVIIIFLYVLFSNVKNMPICG